MTKQNDLKEQMRKAAEKFIQPKNYIPYFDLGDKSLNGNPTLIFSAIYNRLGSSVKCETKFFDKKVGEFYVIYEYSELAELINASTKTVSRIMNKLVEANLIERKKCFNGTYRLFPSLPENVRQKFSPSDHGMKKDNSSSNTNNNQKSNKTPVNNNSSRKETKSPLNYLNFNYLSSLSLNTFNSRKPTNLNKCEIASEKSVLKNYGMPESLIDTIESLSFGSSEKFTRYAKSIMCAKKKVYNQQNKLGNAKARIATMFETNGFIKKTIMQEVSRIILYVCKKYRDQESQDKVMFTSFKNYFEECAVLFGQFGTPELHEKVTA